jgi:hypothetical protein
MPAPVKSQELIAAFTQNIEKIPIKVVIHTSSAVIVGEFHARPNLRLMDEIINGDQFVAITNANVYDKSSKSRMNTKFLVLNREQIDLLIPWEDIERSHE